MSAQKLQKEPLKPLLDLKMHLIFWWMGRYDLEAGRKTHVTLLPDN